MSTHDEKANKLNAQIFSFRLCILPDACQYVLLTFGTDSLSEHNLSAENLITLKA